MNDPVLKKLVDWQARLQRMEARLNELEQLLERSRALPLTVELGEPPPPPSRVN